MLQVSIIVFSYAWLEKNSRFHSKNSTHELCLILFWLPTECKPQGDYDCKENPKYYHRAIESPSSIESWLNNHSFYNDLLLGHCSCLNCLNSILASIWPDPYFNIFHHQEYKRKWFLKIFLIISVRQYILLIPYHSSFLYFTGQFILVR